MSVGDFLVRLSGVASPLARPPRREASCQRKAIISPRSAKPECPGGRAKAAGRGWVTLARATGDESGASERYPRPDGTEC